MTTPSLLEMLTVENPGLRTIHDLFTGPAMPTPNGRSFGGQVMGQALRAASETAPAGREVHSMHGYFLRPGDSNEQLTFEVARLFDGGSFSTRRAQAYQDGAPIMSMIASYQTVDDGVEHQERLDMSQFPSPEELPSMWDKFGHLQNHKRASWVLQRPFDFRYVEGDMMVERPEPSNVEHVWMRAIDDLPYSAILHSAALTFGSDYLLVEPVARAHGLSWSVPGLKAASLDHSMWFHRPFNVNEWLMYVLESPTSHGGRGLSHGKFYSLEGDLVASVSQEVMLRIPNR